MWGSASNVNTGGRREGSAAKSTGLVLGSSPSTPTADHNYLKAQVPAIQHHLWPGTRHTQEAHNTYRQNTQIITRHHSKLRLQIQLKAPRLSV